MHALILEVDTSGAEREESVRRLREEIVPAVSQAPGFQSGTWARHPTEGIRNGACGSPRMRRSNALR